MWQSKAGLAKVQPDLTKAQIQPAGWQEQNCGQFSWFLIENSVCVVIKWDRNREKRQKERKKERKAHCMWGTIRKAAPIEDWSRLLYEVYISATKRAHTACFVPKGWPTQKIHTNAATNWSAHISTQKCSSTLMWTNHGLHNHCPTTLSCFQSPQRKPHADPGWALLEVGGIIATVNPGSDIKRQLSLTSCSVTHWQTLNARRSGKLHSVFPVWQLADSSL